jgi:hypothetical protein
VAKVGEFELFFEALFVEDLPAAVKIALHLFERASFEGRRSVAAWLAILPGKFRIHNFPEGTSFEREKRLGNANFTGHVLRQIPRDMAILAIAFVADDAEDDSQMQQHGGQEEFPGHLRIVHAQRAAGGAMDGLFQNRRHGGVERAYRIVKMVFADLDTEGDARRAQEQKTLEQFVVVGPGLYLVFTQEGFENVAVADVFKNSNIHPGLMMLLRAHD